MGTGRGRSGRAGRGLSRRSRKSLLLVFACVFATPAARHARAECVPFVEQPLVADNLIGLGAVAAADLDGDGDLDALSASAGDDRLLWHENQGSGGAWLARTVSTVLDAPRAVTAADVDGDGDLDVVSLSSGDGRIAWHENLAPGNGASWALRAIMTGVNFGRSVLAADLDRDGDLDLASASSLDDTIAWYRNDGSPADGGWTKVVVAGSVNAANAVFAADLDLDGDLDLISTSFYDDEVVWYENDGDGTAGAWTPHTISTTTPNVIGVAAGDLDRDGDLDIVSSGDDVSWYENDGSDGPWTRITVGPASTARSVLVRDLDRDGDLDIASVSGNDNRVAWHENDGGGGGWTLHSVTTAAAFASALVAADLDDDGDDDLLSANSDFEELAWYRNDTLHGAALFAGAATVSATSPDAASVRAADLDGDGDLDLLAASGADDRIALLRNLGGGTSWAQVTISVTADLARSAVPFDADGDGDLDVLAASAADDEIAWYQNDGDGGTWTHHLIVLIADGARSVFAADVDGDGDQDGLSASFGNDSIIWYDNSGLGTFTTRLISGTANGAYSVAAVDLEGDGDVDALSASFIDGKIAWYENDGTPANGGWVTQTITTALYQASFVAPADLDGDGDADVLATSAFDRVVWFENDGTPAVGAWPIYTITTAVDYPDWAEAADVDRDGDLDVVTTGRYDNTVVWHENDGSGTTWLPHTVTTLAGGSRAVVAADLDGDGDPDLAGASKYDSAIRWYRNRGTKVFADGYESDGATTACWSSSLPPVP